MSPSPGPASRVISLEVEVPGTPEEVWEAIASGPGITSWFVPAEVEGREGGDVRLSFAPGADELGRVTAWEPPSRFAYEAPPEGERRLAFEFHVEAQAGGTCLVRLVNSGFGEGADWDAEYDGMDAGWRLFLQVLRLGRMHFPGEPCASVMVSGRAKAPKEEAWPGLLSALGLASAGEGDAVSSGGAAPPLAGTIGWAGPTMLALVAEAPAPAVVLMAAEGAGGGAYVSVYLYLFGSGAAAAPELEPVWREWMEARFPAG